MKISGKPEIVSLWTDPSRDRSFMKAVKENRVLTLTQEPASKRKDFGRIGFHQAPHASYLVFPRPLPRDAAPRVIGIKYDLVNQPAVNDPVKPEERGRAPRKASRPKRERRVKRFEVIVRRVARIETAVTVENAATVGEARRIALKQVKAELFDPSKTVVRDEVLDVREVRGNG